MSTLVAQTISNGTVSTSSANVIQGSAKAWVNFDGTVATPSTIRASYNVSSITRNSTGDYTINFTNAFADANYCSVGSTTDAGSIAAARLVAFRQNSATTTSTRCETVFQVDTGSEPANMNAVYIAIFR